MVDFVALVTPPILAGPDMKPANGDIYVRSTNTISKSGLVVVPFQVHGKIVDGTFKGLDGGPLMLVVTPEGVALEIHAELVQDGPNGRRDKYRISRTVSTPNQSTVTWDALLDTVPVESGTEYAIPAWVQPMLAEAAAAGPIAIEAANRAELAAASVPTTEELTASFVARDGDGNVPDADIPESIARTANTVATSATGYEGSPSLVQAPVLSPSPVDSRSIASPDRVPSAPTLDKDLTARARRNLWQYTEDFGSDRYSVSSITKATETIVRDGITLTRMSTSSFYGQLTSNINGVVAADLFVPGRRYLLSYYVLPVMDSEMFVWMRAFADSGSSGHGQRLLQPNTLTRVWTIKQAATARELVDISNPTVGFDPAPSGNTWFFKGGNGGATLDAFVGGFQIDDIGTGLVDGIAGIGDSTMQGASSTNDNQSAREWMGYLAGLLNVNTYNRGIGGNKLTDMDARWATDITPLKPVSKYVIIQGGINDIGNGATLAGLQASVVSLVGKAKTDGFIPVVLTCTPASSISSVPAREAIRVAFNAWLKATFPNVIDIAAVVADPFDGTLLRRTPGGVDGWYGDGVHFTVKAKRAIAEKIASWSGWDLPTPSAYQKVTAATFTQSGGYVLASPDGTKYRITVANGGALSAVAI